MGICCSHNRKGDGVNYTDSTENESPKAESLTTIAKSIKNPMHGVNEQSFTTLKTTSHINQIYKKDKTSIPFPYSLVYQVTHIASNTWALMRVVKKAGLEEKISLERFFAGISIQKELDHPNIAKIFELMQDDQNYYIIYEYLEAETLLDFMSKDQSFNEANIILLAKQIASILGYLHHKNILNGYICPENFLFAVTQRIDSLKLFDFSFVETVGLGEPARHTPVSLCYSPPECLQAEKYDKRSEIWSFGAVIYHFVIGDQREQFGDSIEALIDPERFSFPKAFSGDLRRFLLKCLAPEPASRPLISGIIKEPLLQKKIAESGLINTILNRFRVVKVKNRLHQLLLAFLINRILKASDKLPYKIAFTCFDTNYTGTITKAELLSKYIKSRGDFIVAKTEIDQVLYLIDFDKTQDLTFSEFLTIAFDRSALLSELNIVSTFKLLDQDGKGYLTESDLAMHLGGHHVLEDDLRKMVKAGTQQSNLTVSLEDFTEFLLKKN